MSISPIYVLFCLMYNRLVVSGLLQKEHEFYANFIEGYATVKDFCGHVSFICYAILIIKKVTFIPICLKHIEKWASNQKYVIYELYMDFIVVWVSKV